MLGVGYAMAEMLLGTHWTMRIWTEGNIIGFHLKCQEHPQLSLMETLIEGVEKKVENHFLFEGYTRVRILPLPV